MELEDGGLELPYRAYNAPVGFDLACVYIYLYVSLYIAIWIDSTVPEQWTSPQGSCLWGSTRFSDFQLGQKLARTCSTILVVDEWHQYGSNPKWGEMAPFKPLGMTHLSSPSPLSPSWWSWLISPWNPSLIGGWNWTYSHTELVTYLRVPAKLRRCFLPGVKGMAPSPKGLSNTYPPIIKHGRWTSPTSPGKLSYFTNLK